jgi:hypothetical protein
MKGAVVVMVAAAAALISCSSSNPTPADVGKVDASVSEVGQGEVVFPDTGPPSSDILDLQTAETLPDAADVKPLQCSPGEGCFLDKCDENSNCQSGWCVQHLGENVCSQACQDECPAGWSCKQVAGTDPDVVYICVSDFANLCRPCSANADCKSTGGAEDACIDYGPDGSFCGGQCGEGNSCPWGFSCEEVSTVEGTTLQQCVNDTGECPCTGNSVAMGLTTTCTASNEKGICTGKRTCTEEGLSGCDALTPTLETCNGLDDDCDGEADEPELVEGNYVNLCDDGNPCTTDKCMGPEGCVNEMLDAGGCDDGNPCTLGDHCVAGTCIGEPLECNDDNLCTDDACTAEGGCEYTNNSIPCDDDNACTLADHCAEGTCTGISAACECLADADCSELEDGDACNGTLVCDTAAVPYKCVVDLGTLVSCPSPAGENAFCLQAHCDPGTGTCSFIPDHEDFLCDDGDACSVNHTCIAGKCSGGDMVNCNDGNSCTKDSCGDEGCEHSTLGNGTPCLNQPGWQCMNGECMCVGSCEGKVCGSDYCGGNCGDCDLNETCVEGACVFFCNANCIGKSCGDDGCGGSCGDCPDGKDCVGGACLKTCEPSCEGKDCGPNGCGGLCGLCDEWQVCINGTCPPPGDECDDGNDVDWDGCTDGKITEWMVNSYTVGAQYQQDVAVLADDSFVIVWESTDHDEDGDGVFGRVYSPTGEAATPEYQLNSSSAKEQGDPMVTALADGGFAVSWAEGQAGSSNSEIEARVFASTGEAQSGDISVNTFSKGTQQNQEISTFGPDKFGVAWSSVDPYGPGNGVFLQLFTASGSKYGVETNLASDPIVKYAFPELAGRATGGAITIWGRAIDVALLECNVKLLGADLQETGIGAFTTSETHFFQSGRRPTASVWPDGRFVVAYEAWVIASPYSWEGIWGSTYAVNGQQSVSFEIEKPCESPHIAVLSTEDFAVAYEAGSGKDGDGPGIFARMFTPAAEEKGIEFQVNTYFQYSQSRPRVAAFSDGGFVVVWYSSEQDGSGYGIFAQRFDKDGNKVYK